MSVLWVESCRQSGKRVSEDLFPVIDAEEIGTPLIIGKLKRTKSMQPKAFEEDVRNSAGTAYKKLAIIRFITHVIPFSTKN